MRVLVISCGKVGSKLVQVLSEEGHDVVVVDSDRNAFKNLGHWFNGVTVTGVPIDQDVLKQAGIEAAEALVAVTPDDNINIMVSQMAREIFNVPRVIARIYNPAREYVFQQFGLKTICPTNLTVSAIHAMLMGETSALQSTIFDSTFTFRRVRAEKEDEGKPVQDLQPGDDAMVFGIIRDGDFILAKHDTRIKEGDFLVLAEKSD